MKILSSKLVFENFIKIFKIKLKHNKKTFSRDCVEVGSSVAAVVYNVLTKKYIFVKQFRVGSLSELLEIPAGHIDLNSHTSSDEPRKDAIREILEETGYAVDDIKLIVPTYYTSPGFTSETITIFYVEVTNKIGDGGGLEEENENIEVVEMTESEVLRYPWKDGKTIIGLSKKIHNFILF